MPRLTGRWTPPAAIPLAYAIVCSLAISGLGEPVTLVIVYPMVSAFVLPTLSVALRFLLNRRAVPSTLRNGWRSNAVLLACLALCGFLAIAQTLESLGESA